MQNTKVKEFFLDEILKKEKLSNEQINGIALKYSIDTISESTSTTYLVIEKYLNSFDEGIDYDIKLISSGNSYPLKTSGNLKSIETTFSSLLELSSIE